MQSSPGHTANHSTKDCHTLKEVERACQKTLHDGDQPNNKNNGNNFGRDIDSLHTFTGTRERHDNKTINYTVAVHVVTW
jgi:hypothetical protein